MKNENTKKNIQNMNNYKNYNSISMRLKYHWLDRGSVLEVTAVSRKPPTRSVGH